MKVERTLGGLKVRLKAAGSGRFFSAGFLGVQSRVGSSTAPETAHTLTLDAYQRGFGTTRPFAFSMPR